MEHIELICSLQSDIIFMFIYSKIQISMKKS